MIYVDLNCNCTAIDNEKKDAKPEGHFLDITVRLRNQELDRNGSDRRIVIDIRSCDFQEFRSKILEKLQDLQLDVNKLKISMLIPSFNGTSNDRMDVGGEILWRSFIDNHSRNFIGRRSVTCEVGMLSICIYTESPNSIQKIYDGIDSLNSCDLCPSQYID